MLAIRECTFSPLIRVNTRAIGKTRTSASPTTVLPATDFAVVKASQAIDAIQNRHLKEAY